MEKIDGNKGKKWTKGGGNEEKIPKTKKIIVDKSVFEKEKNRGEKGKKGESIKKN